MQTLPTIRLNSQKRCKWLNALQSRFAVLCLIFKGITVRRRHRVNVEFHKSIHQPRISTTPQAKSKAIFSGNDGRKTIACWLKEDTVQIRSGSKCILCSHICEMPAYFTQSAFIASVGVAVVSCTRVRMYSISMCFNNIFDVFACIQGVCVCVYSKNATGIFGLSVNVLFARVSRDWFYM